MAIYAFTALLLLFSTIYHRTEIQDSWTLAGLLPQTLLFTLAFIVYAVNIKKNSKLVLLISTYVMILSAIPNLKYYEQVSGVFDSIAHMGYAFRLASTGFVPVNGFYSNEYSGTPGMHIFLASLSLMTGFSMAITVKILLLILSFSIPLLTYYFINRVFNKKINKFIIYGLCVTLPIYQSIYGTSFALILFFIFISTFLSTYMSSRSHEYIILLVISGASIIISHGVTSLFLAVLLGFIFLFVMIWPRIFKKSSENQPFPKITIYLAIVIVAAVLIWWFLKAQYLIHVLIGQIVNNILSAAPSTQIIPTKFFEITLFQQMVLLFIRFYNVFLVLTLSLIGIVLYYFKLRKTLSSKSQTLVERVVLITFFIGLISVPFLFILTSYTFERFYVYFVPISPILIGLSLMTLFTFFRKRINSSFVIKFFSALFLILLILPNLFTVFIYQPWIPKDKTGEYIVDYREVNTIYQTSMINFAENNGEDLYNYTRVRAFNSDAVTSWQASGLTSIDFFSAYLYTDPLTQKDTRASMILLHYEGISGPLNERSDLRTKEIIDKIKLEHNIIYDNSQSFILLNETETSP